MELLKFQPIEGKADEIVDAILKNELVASCKSLIFTIHIVCEELVVNIVNYAYKESKDSYLKVKIEKENNCLTIIFIDGGIAFNPLDREMPDTSLPLEQRPIGGLGIFLTVQMMDTVTYTRINDENVLTIKKNINDEK